MASLKIYGGPWNVYLNRKAKNIFKETQLAKHANIMFTRI
jgi:hypothetical protein